MQPNESDKNKNKDTLKADNELVRRLAEEKYKYGFTTDVHTDIIDRGLTEDTVRLISEKKGRLPPQGLPPLADDGHAHVGTPPHPGD